MTSNSPVTDRVRIAKIAGRFLVFEHEAVARLRRCGPLNGTFVGTAPQQPTQNIFLGLPVEIRPEEAEALVRRDLAFVVDDVAAHLAALRNNGSVARNAYLTSLKGQKDAAKIFFDEQKSRLAPEMARRIIRQKAQDRPKRDADPNRGVCSEDQESATRYSGEPPFESEPAKSERSHYAATPTSSKFLLALDNSPPVFSSVQEHSPLVHHLQCNGYYLTPGLRFGSMYSVYPGDPLRYHAHFMANEYSWDADIPVLDIVSGGRLATAVKKSFLIAGKADCSKAGIRTFSIEWASM